MSENELITEWSSLVESSGLFDKEYYLTIYDDVRKAEHDPIDHYLRYGAKEGRNPNRNFKSSLYIEENPVLKYTGVNPLVHHILKEKAITKNLKPTIDAGNNSSYKDIGTYFNDDNFEGKIESLKNKELNGWLIDKAEKNKVFYFIIIINDKYNFVINNAKNREDLQRAGKSDGKGGFTLFINDEIDSVNTVQILPLNNPHLSISGDSETTDEDESLTSKPIVKYHEENIRRKKVKVRVEVVNNENLRGWMIDLKNPSKVFSLKVFINGIFFNSIKTDQARKDLKRLNLSAGQGGFKLNLLDVVRKGVFTLPKNTVSIYSDSDELLFEYNIDDVVNETSSVKNYIPLRHETAIIVPIYNAYDDVKVCIERLEKHTPKGTEVILINDASTDSSIRSLLNTVTTDILRFKVIHCKDNLGFTKTVNKGIDLCINKNVILLNSDARVTPRWFEGLTSAASSSHDIATVTAMSDRAGAFSAPNIGNDNELPVGVKEEDFALAFRRYSLALYPTVPTGNGFCMFISRDCIDELGGLDAEAFPRGYGEENDFCMRARKNGWRNIIDDRTYVFHDRSKSFGGEKAELMKAGRLVIDQRYPDYSKAIQFYSKSPIMQAIRYRASVAMDAVVQDDFRPRALYVVSTTTGGTPQTNRDLMTALNDTIEPWLLHCDSEILTLYRVGEQENDIIEQHQLTEVVNPYTHKSAEYDKVVKSWLLKYDFTLMHIRHLVWHSINLPKVNRETGAKTIMSFHDYYVASPNVKLLDTYNEPNSKQHKIAPLWMNYDTPDFREAWNQQWRDMFAEALNHCDSFVTTSESAKATILEHVKLDSSIPFAVINHGRDFDVFRQPNFNNVINNKIRILVPGNIDKNKGLNVINELLELDTDNRLEIHILGNCSEVFDPEKVINHGTYDRKDFTNLVADINPHISAVFSIWNETWCHTLTESWASGVPTVAFNFETIANRLKQTQAGWIVDLGDTQYLYDSIVNKFTEEGEYAEKLENVKLWQNGLGMINNNRYMSIQYLNLYKNALYNFNNPLKEVCGVVVPSNKTLTEANGSSYVRVWQKTDNALDREVSYLRLTPNQLVIGVETGRIKQAIIQRNVLSIEQWNVLKPYVLDKSFEYMYEIDDDLLNVPSDKDAKGYYAKYKTTLENLLRLASVIAVSTQSLRDKYRQYNDNVVIIPNTLNPKYWLGNKTINKDKKVDPNKFLYFGSYTHLEDFKLIAPALDEVYKLNNKFRLKVIGITQEIINKPWVEQIDIPVACKQYPAFIKLIKEQSIDCIAGLAPLTDSEFNIYKSDLKVKEYLGLGLRVIASDIATYKGFRENPFVELIDINNWTKAVLDFTKGSYSPVHLELNTDIFFDETKFDDIVSEIYSYSED